MKKLFFGILLVILISSIGCAKEPEEKIIIYEHEKLYEEYKQENPNDWTPIPANSSHQSSFLLGNDKFNITSTMFSTNAHTAPEIAIYELKTGYTQITRLGLDFYAYNEKGEEVAVLSVGSYDPGYYDPFEGDWEPYCWYRVSDDKLEIKMLAVEQFFVGEKYLPWAMTEEEYQTITAKIKELNNEEQLVYWDSMVGDWIANEENLQLLGLKYAINQDVFNEGIHVLKGGVDFPHILLDDILKKTGITTNQKRIIESKVVKENYEAHMAMITMTIDISGIDPIVEFNYEVISPKESDIAVIYFSEKDYDINKEIADIFKGK